MLPEETVQAAIDLKGEALLPVHWGKFALAFHAWDDPVIRLLRKAKEMQVKVATPRIGEAVIVGGEYPSSAWWSLNEGRSEEHTSEHQSLMRIQYAVFCLKT